MSSGKGNLGKRSSSAPQKRKEPPQPEQGHPAAVARQRIESHVVQMDVLPPEMLAQFDKVIPGSAQRLLENTLEESAFRRKMEERALEANIATQSRQATLAERQVNNVRVSDLVGQGCGLAVCAGCIAGSIYLGSHYPENWKVPVALAAIPTAAVIRAFFVRPDFFLNKKQKGQDRKE